ncbi:MAG TPA: hypothetical protein VNN07_17320 [Candidatus Tectomicrobia bacterium]|nr:hypothetical protein [Candidatus Tectomicrobia bacterium]
MTASARTERASPPAAAVSLADELAGRWTGVVWETGPAFYQGHESLDVRIAENATWSGTVGHRSAAGVVRTAGEDLVLTGEARDPATGARSPIYYRLVGSDERRWGETLATFGGRPANASIDLRRTSEPSA